MQIKSTELAIKDIAERKGIVTVYLSGFGNVDSDGDMIVKGAFAKTIADRGPGSYSPRIKHLKNHDVKQAVGRILELYEDDKGLVMVSQLSKSTLGHDTLEEYVAGIITEHSIGFEVVHQQKEKGYNMITDVRLWEGSSLTGWGSNPMTPVVDIKTEKDAVEKLEEMVTKMQLGLLPEKDEVELMTFLKKMHNEFMIHQTIDSQQLKEIFRITIN